jgi:hypothetical protein
MGKLNSNLYSPTAGGVSTMMGRRTTTAAGAARTAAAVSRSGSWMTRQAPGAADDDEGLRPCSHFFA